MLGLCGQTKVLPWSELAAHGYAVNWRKEMNTHCRLAFNNADKVGEGASAEVFRVEYRGEPSIMKVNLGCSPLGEIRDWQKPNSRQGPNGLYELTNGQNAYQCGRKTSADGQGSVYCGITTAVLERGLGRGLALAGRGIHEMIC
jgi:hypothetical protein